MADPFYLDPRALDDDDFWRPLEVEHQRLTERCGNPDHAAFKLNEALARGELHCARCGRATGWTRKVLPPAFWTAWELRWWAKEGLRPKHRGFSGLNVCPHGPREQGASYVSTLGSATFFISAVDADRLWPQSGVEGARATPPIVEKPAPAPQKNSRRFIGKQLTAVWRRSIIPQIEAEIRKRDGSRFSSAKEACDAVYKLPTFKNKKKPPLTRGSVMRGIENHLAKDWLTPEGQAEVERKRNEKAGV